MNERTGPVLAPFTEPGGRSYTANEPLTRERFDNLVYTLEQVNPTLSSHLKSNIVDWAENSGGRIFFKKVDFPVSGDVVVDQTPFHFPASLKNETLEGYKLLLADGNKTVAALFSRLTPSGARHLLITTGIDGVKRVNGVAYRGGHLSEIESDSVREFLVTRRIISLDSEGARTFDGVRFRGVPRIQAASVRAHTQLSYWVEEILHSQRRHEILGFSVNDILGNQYADVKIMTRDGKKIVVVEGKEYEVREGTSVKLYRLSQKLGQLLDGFRKPSKNLIPRYEIPGSLDARALETRRRFPDTIKKKEYLNPNASIKPALGPAETDGRVYLGHLEADGLRRPVRFCLGPKYEGSWVEVCPKTYDKDYGWLFSVFEIDKKTKRRASDQSLATLRVNPQRVGFMETIVPDIQAFKDSVAGVKNFRGETIEPRVISRKVSREMYEHGYLNIGKITLDGIGFNARVYFRAERLHGQVLEGERIVVSPDVDDRYGPIFKVEIIEKGSQARRLSTYRMVRSQNQLLEKFDPIVQTWIDFAQRYEADTETNVLPKPIRARIRRSNANLFIGDVKGIRIECSDNRLRRFERADVVFAEVDWDYGPLFNVFGVNGGGKREPKPLMKVRVNREKRGNLEVIEPSRRSFVDFVNGKLNSRGRRIKPRTFLATADHGSQPFIFLGRGPSGREMGFHLKRDSKPGAKVIIEPVSINSHYVIDVFTAIKSPLDEKYYKLSLIETYEISQEATYGFRVAGKKRTPLKVELTDMEKRIISLLTDGKTIDEISSELSLLRRRTESMVGSVFSKLGTALVT
jgi:hypothetical protein